jgi:hypothetical protein
MAKLKFYSSSLFFVISSYFCDWWCWKIYLIPCKTKPDETHTHMHTHTFKLHGYCPHPQVLSTINVLVIQISPLSLSLCTHILKSGHKKAIKHNLERNRLWSKVDLALNLSLLLPGWVKLNNISNLLNLFLYLENMGWGWCLFESVIVWIKYLTV